MENLVEKKKIGRPLFSEKIGAMDSKTRQARARSLALKYLSDGNENGISSSMLVALLPSLMAKNHGRLIERVCNELKNRFL